MTSSAGLHHVTAISGEPRRNVDFYVRTLGLRLVKKTVNFDDPGTYHLYYGDEAGAPGTILTFFPWAHVAPGRRGAGETSETAFIIPVAAVSFWLDRFMALHVKHQLPEKRFGETVIRFEDPDGMPLALVARAGAEQRPGHAAEGVPAEQAIRGFAGVTLTLADPGRTALVLINAFGWRKVAEEGDLQRFQAPSEPATLGNIVDLRAAPGLPRAGMGGGSVHHIAFRAANDAEQETMAAALGKLGLHTTEQKDRNYFRSVYFREPGGVIFEIATDDPGFAVDEPATSLGEALKLPSWLEPHRGEIEKALPALA